MERQTPFLGKRILLGVTGSIAAYKAADILRRLQDEGAEVRVAMTPAATRFVAPLTFAALSGQPVLTDEFDPRREHEIAHVAYSEGIDCAVIAPATANVVGKLAAGIADDALTAALMACDCPRIVAPAMNDRMFRNPVVQRNLDVLKELGIRIVEPEHGWLACGTTGRGRLADVERIVQVVGEAFVSGDLGGMRVLVTAGPTREHIDPVRFLSNPSTGKMGYAIAQAAKDRGASVVLISGPTHLDALEGVKLVRITSADEMSDAVNAYAERSDVIIMAAAVSDFRPVTASGRKVRKQDIPEALHLVRNEDILQQLGKASGRHILVGFAAESGNPVPNALRKLKEKNLDFIVANDVSSDNAGFAVDTNKVTIIDREGTITDLPLMSKREIGEQIIQKVSQLIAKQRISP